MKYFLTRPSQIWERGGPANPLAQVFYKMTTVVGLEKKHKCTRLVLHLNSQEVVLVQLLLKRPWPLEQVDLVSML
jgi:hypothetical protein